KLAYRRWWAPDVDSGTLGFDAAELTYYPVSNFIRAGVDGEFAWGGGKYGLWSLLFGASLGLQWPARVTPFLEGRFVAGLVGGHYENQVIISWMYAGGIEGGVEVYYFRRFFVTAALGWTHPVYGAIDAAALIADPHSQPMRKTLN